MWANRGRQGQAEHAAAAEARIALLSVLKVGPRLGQLPFCAVHSLCVFSSGQSHGRVRAGETQKRRESGLWLPWGLAPLCQRLDIFLSICGTLLRDNVRVFLHTCSCFCFSVLKSVCVLTCPLQYPYRYICCVPYEMLGSGKSNQPTHRLLTVSTSAFD